MRTGRACHGPLAHLSPIPPCQRSHARGCGLLCPHGQVHPFPSIRSCLLAALWAEVLHIHRGSPPWRRDARNRSVRLDRGSGHLFRGSQGSRNPECGLEGRSQALVGPVHFDLQTPLHLVGKAMTRGRPEWSFLNSPLLPGSEVSVASLQGALGRGRTPWKEAVAMGGACPPHPAAEVQGGGQVLGKTLLWREPGEAPPFLKGKQKDD